MRRVIGISVVLLLLLVLSAALLFFQKRPPAQRVLLADGKIIHIEAVTYGTNHQVGVRSVIVDRFGPWLPQMIRPVFEPKFPQSSITRTYPALVIWVNATDATGKPVDSQALRVELVNEHGESFGEETRNWFGFGKFSRVGHVFEAYPRHLKEMKVQLTPWRTNRTTVTTIVNPRIQSAASWQGDALPAKQRVGETEVVLQSLTERPHGSKYWETRTRYWEPVWELWKNGRVATGWDAPEWTAEDPTGNRGKHLGIHQPVLRCSATFYPSATNEDAGRLIGRLPCIGVQNLQSNILWNTNLNFESTRVFVLGVLPPGVNTFTGAAYDPKPAVKMGAVAGGAPSGWTSTSRRVTPMREQHWYGHYTPVPTIYIKPSGLKPDIRIGVRLRDDSGRYWLAKPEPQGIRDDVRPFLIELPGEIKVVTPEVVILEPVQATFQVRTPAR